MLCARQSRALPALVEGIGRPDHGLKAYNHQPTVGIKPGKLGRVNLPDQGQMTGNHYIDLTNFLNIAGETNLELASACEYF